MVGALGLFFFDKEKIDMKKFIKWCLIIGLLIAIPPVGVIMIVLELR